MTYTKICCISSVAEAELAIRHGARAIGLVSQMPSGPGVIAESRIQDIVATVPRTVATVLLTSLVSPVDIVAQQKRCGATALQLCDELPAGAHTALRDALPGVTLVQVVHVTGEESVAEARDIGGDVDALLLDSGRRSLPVKELGGTGRTHDWSLSARIVVQSEIPVYLAGGLNASNVREAIRTVRPFGVDVCSGVRTAGALDADKLEQFMGQVRAAV